MANDAQRWRQVAGWVGVAISTAITCFWAFWGIIENFHEGWYHESWLKNLGMMFGQYLAPMLGFLTLGLVSIRWPIAGALLHLGLAIFAMSFFDNSMAAQSLIVTPLVLLAIVYLFSQIRNKRLASGICILLPVITLLVFGAEPAVRMAGRVDDGNRGERRMEIGDKVLVWAPEGPGWPDSGTTWDEAVEICERLEADGRSLSDQRLGIWRLPQPAEIVAAQHRRNQPCGGRYDPVTGTARYDVRPDKETPLWNPHSQVIYMWTLAEVDSDTALMIAYDGNLWPRPKSADWGYLGFRAVREFAEPAGSSSPH